MKMATNPRCILSISLPDEVLVTFTLHHCMVYQSNSKWLSKT